ncbi:MAG: hypothetical protein AAGI07_00285 [Bacteroidota bacterium]
MHKFNTKVWQIPRVSGGKANPLCCAETNFQGDRLAIAQGSSKNWYFGTNAGLRFSTDGTVNILTDGQINQNEGAYTVSDADGQLLFYTDGATIWNRKHQVMATGLHGNQSSATSAVVAPRPGTTQYYVFTVDENIGTNGFNYYIVDLSLNNGLGQVITKNQNLLASTNATEKIALVKHENNIDWWIITHGFNNNHFYAYLLSGNGLATTPVVTAIGITYNQITDKTGFIKDNFAQNKLAVSSFGGGGQAKVELFDFNSSTGVLSNVIDTGIYINPYSVEFSPNDRYLYISETAFNQFTFDRIYRYDLTLATRSTYWERLIGSTTQFHFTLQAALNGKIYISFNNQNALSVIDSPNEVAVSFIENAQSIAPGSAQTGLPYMPKSYLGASATLQPFPANIDEIIAEIVNDKAVSPNQLGNWWIDKKSNDTDLLGVITDRHTHSNKALLDSLINNGSGNEFLASDGTYKIAAPSGFEPGSVILADALGDLSEDTSFVYKNSRLGINEANPDATLRYNADVIETGSDVLKIRENGDAYDLFNLQASRTLLLTRTANNAAYIIPSSSINTGIWLGLENVTPQNIPDNGLNIGNGFAALRGAGRSLLRFDTVGGGTFATYTFANTGSTFDAALRLERDNLVKYAFSESRGFQVFNDNLNPADGGVNACSLHGANVNGPGTTSPHFTTEHANVIKLYNWGAIDTATGANDTTVINQIRDLLIDLGLAI